MARRRELDRFGAESSDIPGTRIDLTVARQLFEPMDGAVGFESTVGKGTAFWIEVPFAPSDE
jgi:signal transduction histidine kinase